MDVPEEESNYASDGENEEVKEETIQDSEYSTKAGFSKAELVSMQMAKCLNLRSCDMRPGYTSWVDNKPEVIPDSRKAFIGSVEGLFAFLKPEVMANKPEIATKWKEDVDKIFDCYAYKERIGRKFTDNSNKEGVPNPPMWVLSGRKFMPQKGATIMIAGGPSNGIAVDYSKTAWDNKIDAFFEEKLIAADELFADLSVLIHDIDYFKGDHSL